MKKLILILTITLLAAVSYGQSLGQTTIVAGYDVSTTGDTLLDFPYDIEFQSYAWRIDVTWDSIAWTLDGILKMRSTAFPGLPNDSVWVDYPNMSSVTVNSVQGECSFEDTYLAARRIGLLFDKNNITSGTISVYMTLKPR